CLRNVPSRGVGYGIIRYLRGETDIGEWLRSLGSGQVSFNYLGQFEEIVGEGREFGLARESIDGLRSGRAKRSHVIGISGMIIDGSLQLDWQYSAGLHRRTTIEALAATFIESLRKLIEHCLAPGLRGYTPSDFPKIKIDQTSLDSIILE